MPLAEAFHRISKSLRYGIVGQPSKDMRRRSYNLALQLYEGQGIPPDRHEAFRWFLRAAKQGHVPAQFNVAVSYGQGNGVLEDQNEALKWIIICARSGHREANDLRDRVVHQYSRLQIAEAERRAVEWHPESERRTTGGDDLDPGTGARTPEATYLLRQAKALVFSGDSASDCRLPTADC
jgi:TPR repeat protein